MGLLILFLITCSLSQLTVTNYYPNTACTGNPFAMDTFSSGCSITTPGPCTTLAGGTSKRALCQSTLPAAPAGTIQFTFWNSGTCSGTAPFLGFYGPPGTCVTTASSASFQLSCGGGGGGVTWTSFTSSASCTGTQSAGSPVVNSGSCSTCNTLNCKSSCTVASGGGGGGSGATAGVVPSVALLALILVFLY